MKMVISRWVFMIACVLQCVVLVAPSNHDRRTQHSGTRRTSHDISHNDWDGHIKLCYRCYPSQRYHNYEAKSLFRLHGGKRTSFLERFIHVAHDFISRLLPLSWTKRKNGKKNKSRYGTKRTNSNIAAKGTMHGDGSNRLQKVRDDCNCVRAARH